MVENLSLKVKLNGSNPNSCNLDLNKVGCLNV